jgi:hypothetical protein
VTADNTQCKTAGMRPPSEVVVNATPGSAERMLAVLEVAAELGRPEGEHADAMRSVKPAREPRLFARQKQQARNRSMAA